MTDNMNMICTHCHQARAEHIGDTIDKCLYGPSKFEAATCSHCDWLLPERNWRASTIGGGLVHKDCYWLNWIEQVDDTEKEKP
jgi:hypothetical protein